MCIMKLYREDTHLCQWSTVADPGGGGSITGKGLNVLIRLNFTENRMKMKKNQECIPVGCVPPAHYRMGVSLTELVMDRDTLDRDIPWTETHLDRERSPRQRPPVRNPPWGRDPPG